MTDAAAPSETEFRAEVRDWMAEHLTGDFGHLRFRGGPGDEHAFVKDRMAWERNLLCGNDWSRRSSRSWLRRASPWIR